MSQVASHALIIKESPPAYAYVYVCIYIYIYIYIYLYIYIHTCICMCVYVYIYIIYVYIHVFIHLDAYVHMYISLCQLKTTARTHRGTSPPPLSRHRPCSATGRAGGHGLSLSRKFEAPAYTEKGRKP